MAEEIKDRMKKKFAKYLNTDRLFPIETTLYDLFFSFIFKMRLYQFFGLYILFPFDSIIVSGN